MTKPEHWVSVEPDFCEDCKHNKRTYHHCSACCDNDEYTCLKHDFVMDDNENSSHVCRDFDSRW
jgi:hypothetical protein